MRRHRNILRTAQAAVALGVVTLGVAACGAGGNGPSNSNNNQGNAKETAQQGGAITHGGTVIEAGNPGQPPDYIFPIETSTLGQGSATDESIAGTMWTPLYESEANAPVLDVPLSMAYAPVYSDGDRVATITMKHYMWSNGKPVTARDMQFFYNLVKAVGPSWEGYVTGEFPQSVTQFKVLGTYKFQMTLNKAYNPTWFTDDQLISSLMPLPQQAWDKTSVDGKIGNYDETPAGAKAVWAFLSKQGGNQSTYNTNPLWRVVDGAWKMSSYGGTTQPTVFVPNKQYSGRQPYIAKLEIMPYTSTTAEFNAMRSGTKNLTMGAIDPSDVPEIPELESEGYVKYQQILWHINYVMLNFTNPTYKSLFNQLYIRQALQELINQPADIKGFLAGLGTPITGITPTIPANNQFISPLEKTSLYPYSVTNATKLLQGHGWKIVKGGADVCEHAGSGASDCGAGVAAGTRLEIPFLATTEVNSLVQMSQNFVSDAAQAGIKLDLHLLPFNAGEGVMVPCTHGSACKWALGTYGGDGEDMYPDSIDWYGPGTGSGFNSGDYVSPTLDKMGNAIMYGTNSVAAYHKFADYVARNLPDLWFPDPFQVSDFVVAKNLHFLKGTVPFTAEFGSSEPQDWYFTKSK